MKIVFLKPAKKFMLSQAKNQQIRLLRTINQLPQGDIKQLKGRSGQFRLRVGNFRVIFQINEDIIVICEIGNRGDIYK